MDQVSSSQETYKQEGYYLSPYPVVPTDVIDRAVAGMDAIRAGEYDTDIPPLSSPWNPGDDPKAFCKIEMPQIASTGIYELVSHPALGRFVADVTGANMVQVWWVQLLYKPSIAPNTDQATSVGWHQDRQYWKTWEEGSDLFTAWVALSDVTGESGPMRFVRQSHQWGFLDQGDFYGQDHSAQQQEIKVPSGANWEESPAILARGEVSIHHCLTYHASDPNYSNRPRRSLAIHMRSEKAFPREGIKEGLTGYLDRTSYCPTIYGTLP